MSPPRRAQFLFQDAVRARLGVEARAFAESRSSGEAGPYRMATAQRLAADFARLGSAPDGLSYLDHLRKLITGGGLTFRKWLSPAANFLLSLA